MKTMPADSLKRVSLSFVVFLFANTLYPQTVNSFAVWISGGYNNLIASRDKVAYLGGLATDFGLGYDLRSTISDLKRTAKRLQRNDTDDKHRR